MKVRVRIAPTPSGKLHLGTAHTALFNYLFAKHNKGIFVLRIDDSDPKRCKKEYEKDIFNSLKWLGIDWDEGPDIGGPFGPYRQGERMGRYWPYVEKLLQENKAYLCFCTQEELKVQREKMVKAGIAPKYSGKCRKLSLSQIERYRKEGRKAAVRLKVPKKTVSFIDPARGKISVNAADFGDIIIARSDKTALLGLASTIDDIEMKITHTIRGEDYINFVPRQILIFEALGFKPPVFAHLPFVYAPDGTKLSKRHGATAVSDYRKSGYLPEAIFNYLTLLGWSPKDDRQIMTKKEIIKLFKLKDVNTNPHRFDFKKLDWINSNYIKNTDNSLVKLLSKFVSFKISNKKLIKVIPLLKERITKLSEVEEMLYFLIKRPKISKLKLQGEKSQEQLTEVLKVLINLKDWKHETIYKACKDVFEKGKFSKKEFFQNLYITIEGKKAGLPVFESMEILGKKECLERIKSVLDKT